MTMRMLGTSWSALAFAAVALGFPEALRADRPAIDFNRDIRPILSNRCYKCHGPDDHERKAGLRLDTGEGAQRELESGARAVVPGDPDESELILRVMSDDPTDRMPPTGEKLSEAEIDRLRAWIDAGAPYAVHWSYVVPARPEAPAPADPTWADWPKGAVDRFLLDRMLKAGLHPSAEADREALIRRVSLDLTGLPPTLEDIERFATDPSPSAYEALVDRLLASPAYGEHWGRMWLDLARYADSAGYADDPPRTIWAYRDWVIRAFNENKPFDQFTIEQIAGDLLPEAREDQLIATAFHRNTLTNNEGGTSDEEFRNVAVVDRVNTTMAVWMGTTMACAQCHTHKYDPITQEEYFRFFAFFNNTADADRRDESPLLEIWDPARKARKESLEHQAKQLEAELSTQIAKLTDAQRAWEARITASAHWNVLKPGGVQLESAGVSRIQDDGSVLIPEKERADVTTVEAQVSGQLTAIQLETLPHPSLPGGGAGHGGGNFVITGLKASLGGNPLKLTDAVADFSQEGFDPKNVLDEDMPTPSGWAVSPKHKEKHTLTVLLGEPVDAGEGKTLVVTIEQRSPHLGHTLGSFRLRATGEGAMAEVLKTPPAIVELARITPEDRTEAQRTELSNFYAAIAPETKHQRDRLAALKKEIEGLKPETTVPILKELPEGQRRETHVQMRGNFMDLGPKVTEGVPAAFHPLPEGKADRLALARWLVDPKNPLTPRVLVNHYWEALFGRGLVPTAEDFGTQGEPPSHPELLDWLAVEVVESGWDLKALVRTLVTSAAYRQSSRVTDLHREKDPENVWLARGPRFRLSAEMVRDQALAVSGLLSPKLYGEPVKPPQPQMGLSAAFGSGIDWQTSAGADRYRRGLYTTWRRSNPYPSMAAFDAPNREVCTLVRSRTNTPLQALVTLNDPVYIEASQALARRLLSNATTAKERGRLGFRLCLARQPTDAELAALERLYEQARAKYAGDPDAARKLASDPLGPPPEGMDLAELAAWTAVGNVLLNLDETLMKR